jgi:uncharacterized protein (TIGR02453 family)
MSTIRIKKSTLTFLRKLQKNNHRDWMEENKKTYQDARANLKAFMVALESKMNETDVIENHSLSRINRDIRFSKDKTPYKDYFWGYLRRFGANRRGGYTMSIEATLPHQVGGGFYSPNKEDLYRIRKEFELDATPIRTILNHPEFVEKFGVLQGEGVKTAPRGFDKNHPNIDLIRKKQFYAHQSLEDNIITSSHFLDEVVDSYRVIRPFFDYMTEIVTTDTNGESIL